MRRTADTPERAARRRRARRPAGRTGRQPPERRTTRRRTRQRRRRRRTPLTPLGLLLAVILFLPVSLASNFWELEPESRIISGTLTTEEGTDAEGNAAAVYMLLPDRPLLLDADGMEGEKVWKIQLLTEPGSKISLSGSVGRRVEAAGMVYAAYSADQRSPLVMVLSRLSPVPTVAGFQDVYATDYYAAAVQWAVRRGITNGTSKTLFSPGDGVTTAQALTFLWRASGSPAPTIPHVFQNLDSGGYYYRPALWGYEKGLISGFYFDGDALCTRKQVIQWMWKLEGSPAVGADPFYDVPFGAEYAKAVAWAVEKGVTSGTSTDAFAPEGICTRGQMAAFLYRNR